MSDCFNQQHLKAYVTQRLELHNASQGNSFVQSVSVLGEDRKLAFPACQRTHFECRLLIEFWLKLVEKENGYLLKRARSVSVRLRDILAACHINSRAPM